MSRQTNVRFTLVKLSKIYINLHVQQQLILLLIGRSSVKLCIHFGFLGEIQRLALLPIATIGLSACVCVCVCVCVCPCVFVRSYASVWMTRKRFQISPQFVHQSRKRWQIAQILLFPMHRMSPISIRLVYLHLIFAHSKGQGQGRANVDCDRLDRHCYCRYIGSRLLTFDWYNYVFLGLF